MLACPEYLPCEALGIKEDLYTALMQVEIDLRSGKLVHCFDYNVPYNCFNMGVWGEKCGTVHCIGGWCAIYRPQMAREIYHLAVSSVRPFGFHELCYPFDGADGYKYDLVTAIHAANAIRNYLMTGKPRWGEVLAE